MLAPAGGPTLRGVRASRRRARASGGLHIAPGRGRRMGNPRAAAALVREPVPCGARRPRARPGRRAVARRAPAQGVARVPAAADRARALVGPAAVVTGDLLAGLASERHRGLVGADRPDDRRPPAGVSSR